MCCMHVLTCLLVDPRMLAVNEGLVRFEIEGGWHDGMMCNRQLV